ncbi:E3 ubiquitin-protein ligase RNF103-like [Macrosteles quadrilineatus]|uniref:E3 ubiquitin-protein ligase RNF103-like n=1 Tax=Macrosteles quadrilineatus TaxID=74068 RepID=UPI0023E23849|nr:E3 ubiquitin-protein ligase RNF103-like [Macrosteles quadrilineatus]XP_054263288.1 E3 ubiquitin-protein ligase RNF103-like [Macrosteles quadrilineatus]XP_054263296.1 E3 ubiquitin-protein ligase RNF103-like [Macrosteles quadrilineatus]
MKSTWTPLCLLVLYLVLMFMVARLLDLLTWCHQGVTPTDMVDPLLLSVRQLKLLLEIRGISYTGYYEKRELAHLVESTADVSQGELEELDSLVDSEERDRLVKTPHTSQFSGSAHFYEQVEDTKDSVWLVQVVVGNNEPLLDDYRWRMIKHYVAPFAIRTGMFDCKLDRRLCKSKGWNEPLLLLAMPKGTTPKDKVVIRTCTYTKPQKIINWMSEQLSIRVHKLAGVTELGDWLSESDEQTSYNQTAVDSLRDVKVLLLTHLLHPPLFLAALSIKFTGRIKFGMITVKKEDEGTMRQKLKRQLNAPSYLVITPERTIVYGQKHGEHFNFWAMNALLRAVQPDANDVFLCSLIFANMIAFLHIVQVGATSWWKHLVGGVWTFVSYNLWLFATWLVILGTCRWPIFSTASDQLLVLVRSIALTDLGNNLRNDVLLLFKHPLLFIMTFLLFVFMTKKFVFSSQNERDPEDRPWWEVLPLDCLFRRPMASLSLPLPPPEIQLEEGIELLIERLAVPNLWLQPSAIVNDYIKDLPVWKYQTPTNADNESKEIMNLMDGDCHCKYDSSSEESITDSKEEFSNCPVKGMLPASSCAICLDSYHNNTVLCGLPCGHTYHKRCIHTWLLTDNHLCPICRWPVYKNNHPRFKQ